MTAGHSGIEYFSVCMALPVGADCRLLLPRAWPPRIPAGAPQVPREGGLIPCMHAGDGVLTRLRTLLAWGLAVTPRHTPGHRPTTAAPSSGSRTRSLAYISRGRSSLRGPGSPWSWGTQGSGAGPAGQEAAWAAMEQAGEAESRASVQLASGRGRWEKPPPALAAAGWK